MDRRLVKMAMLFPDLPLLDLEIALRQMDKQVRDVLPRHAKTDKWHRRSMPEARHYLRGDDTMTAYATHESGRTHGECRFSGR